NISAEHCTFNLNALGVCWGREIILVWSHSVWRWRQQQWEAIQHPMTKMETTSSVRRPESGTWQSVAIETAAMGGRYRDP
ncbi:unnamed protein product, partial [Staurois parvus]